MVFVVIVEYFKCFLSFVIVLILSGPFLAGVCRFLRPEGDSDVLYGTRGSRKLSRFILGAFVVSWALRAVLTPPGDAA